MLWCNWLSEAGEKSSHDLLLESPNDAAELLKLAAHPARIRILALLLGGERSFSGLMRRAGFSKTALANHISLLAEKDLVEKTGRGEYCLTADGRGLVDAVAIAYRGSVRRQEALRELLAKRYTEGLKEVKSLEKKSRQQES